MIEIRNIFKRFDNRYVLKDINLNLPRYGLVIFNGPSGCGKTTLLNIISTLLDFEGDVILDGKSYQKSSNEEKETMRNKKIGFVFQDYKLFEFETVKNNILLSINLSSVDSEKKKEKKVSDVLKLVGLYNKENELVSNLSGGQKQRVAIARAIANSPSILLADEPTGNLDENNTEVVMELLQKISLSSLVLMVSHDKSITEKYADQIIEMSDGEIKKITYQNRKKHKEYLPILKLKYNDKKRILPFKFIFSHTLNSIKRRKWRTTFITMATSFGLIGVGLASALSSIVSSNLYKSYSSIIDSNKLIVSSKNQSVIKDNIISANYEEVSKIYEANKSDISHIGVYYWNVGYLFASEDYLNIGEVGGGKPLSSFNSVHINEFKLLKDNTESIYPNNIPSLTNNEVVISIPSLVINEVCYQLQIARSVKSLSNYIDHHELYICFTFSNESWGYSMEVPLKVRGFILSNKQLLYHTNPFWNEYIFENVCHLPSTFYINTTSLHPWDLIKSYYLNFHRNRDEFLTKERLELDNREIDYEILDKKYYPLLYQSTSTYEVNRLMVIHRSYKDDIPAFIGNYSKKTSKDVKKIIYGSNSGYVIYQESLMMGFSRNTYLGYKEDEILDVVDLMGYIKYEDSINLSPPKNILEGHFSKSGLSGFIFEPDYSIIKGREPVNYQEILISQELAERLEIDSPINKIIHLSYPVKEDLLSNGYINREFATVGLKVVGITDNTKLTISHNEAWTILFFQTMLGMSTFELRINNLAIGINEGKENIVIDKLVRAFPNIEVSAPLKELKSSVDRICHYIEIIMLVVSISSVIIASFILIICNYLHFVEAKKDVGLVRCLGVKEKESRKFVYYHSFLMSGLSLLFAYFELILISFVLSKTLAGILMIESTFILNPFSFLYMFGVALFISLVSSLSISKKISSLDPLECLS